MIESSKYIVVGNVDCGKTSFISVMEKNVLDDGNGYARSLITRLKHEKETGKTSCHSCHYLVKNNEITTLIDLCGHERFLKTTIFGVMGMFCDYGIVMIGANMGIVDMTKEHMSLLMANRIPFIILVNKIDICPPNILISLKKDLDNLFRKNKKSVIYFEESEDNVSGSYLKKKHQIIFDNFHSGKTDFIPIIMISNKTGHNIEFVRELLTSIKSKYYLERNMIELKSPSIMYIDNLYTVIGIGIVLSGTVKYGDLHLGQKVFIGPINNTYVPLTIKSIHNCVRQNVSILRKDESGCIGIRLDNKNSFNKKLFRKGQIIASDIDFAQKHTCKEFNCEIIIFNHPTTIKKGYCAIINCFTVKQPGKFMIEENKVLRTNSKENINIQFTTRAEFMLPNSLFMFRDGRTKGMGIVRSIVPYVFKHKIEISND